MIPIPKRLEERPRYKGLPIPYVALIKPDGQPDFRVVFEDNRMQCICLHWCQLCGQLLGKHIFFVGGPECAKGNLYFEPATHLDCLMYAMQVCPFIAGKMEHAEVEKVRADMKAADPTLEIHIDPTFTTVRSPWWVIKKALSYRTARYEGSQVIYVMPQGIICETEPLEAAKMGPGEWAKIEQQLKEAR